MMTNALRSLVPPNVKMVERANLRDILAEQDLAAAGVIQPVTLHRIAGQLGEADFLLLTNTATRSNDAQDILRYDAVTFVAGTKWVPNPAYAQALQEVNDAQQALANARTNAVGMGFLGGVIGAQSTQGHQLLGNAATGLGSAGVKSAQDRYNAAAYRLQQTPQSVTVPDERVYQYPVVRVTRNATVVCGLRLVDVQSGQVVWDEDNLAHTVQQADTYVKPEPRYGVPGKQLLLSSPEQLCAEAVERLEPEIHKAAQALLRHRSEAYLLRANRSTSENERKSLKVRYLFDPGPNPTTSTVSATAREVLTYEIDEVRRGRCEESLYRLLQLSR